MSQLSIRHFETQLICEYSQDISIQQYIINIYIYIYFRCGIQDLSKLLYEYSQVSGVFFSTVFLVTFLRSVRGLCRAWTNAGLQHERSEVRQMSSALLNNVSLSLVDGLPDSTEGVELSDEVTQILFGSLEGLEDETSEVKAAGRFLHRSYRSPIPTRVHDLNLSGKIYS